MDAEAQLRGSLADRYEIEREIGAGGMATVYLAHDTRHDRPVALKVLKPDLGAVLGVERFLSEIKVTANLQHPNLLPLFDSGAVDGLLYYVMPFVEGESLRSRLDREKQLPIDDAIRIAVAIANALDYAHSHGVIHRDLKPENILMQSGQPVIADFGIALAVSKAGGNRITQTGLSLGTPQYMSPEQATGDRVIDGRSDIYSLGAVAYEMLTGDAPHTGSTSQAIIARMLTEKPRSMRSTRAAIPEHVELAVQHSLEKLPADRFSTAREFAEAIQGRGPTGATTLYSATHAAPVASHSQWISRVKDPVVIAAVAVAVGAIAFAALRKQSAADTTPVVRYVVSATADAPVGTTFPWPGAISPDGSTVVYFSGKTSRLVFLRSDQLEPREIPGTDDASQILFSADGEWIAFESKNKLRKVRLDGSAPIAVTDAGSDNGADWTSQDQIILGSENDKQGLSRVKASGGTLVEFVKPDKSKGEMDYLWPIATPDGKSVVFAIWTGSLASAKLASVSVDGGKVNYLDIAGIRPLAVIDRTLVYVQADGIVMAVKLNRSASQVDGEAVPVLDPVYVPGGVNGNSEIFVSRGGGLLTSRGRTNSKLAWIGKTGTIDYISNEVQAFGSPRLSPDQQSIAVTVTDQGKSAIWIYDLSNKTFTRLSTADSPSLPIWSPDGRLLYYVGLDDKQLFGIWTQKADGSDAPQNLLTTKGPTSGLAISPDGKSLLAVVYLANSWNLYSIDIAEPAKMQPYASAQANETSPKFSPDGKWVALVTDESGKAEVFVRSWPTPTVRIQVSAGGGSEPTWSPDGSTVYYRSGAALVAARLTPPPSIRVRARDTVLTTMGGSLSGSLTAAYDLARDGRLISRVNSTDDYQLIVVPNWRKELDQKLARANRK
jgi:serine/threonine-protein kinase